MSVPNPFKRRRLQAHFAACVAQYKARHRNLFHGDGSRNMGNVIGSDFWRGFDGDMAGRWDAESKLSLSYATWKAGQAIARAREKANEPI